MFMDRCSWVSCVSTCKIVIAVCIGDWLVGDLQFAVGVRVCV
jgi:hypothetical protein